MIKEISIRNVASFGESDGDLTKLKEINFVYGSNATGKTTISRVIHDPGSFSDCSISWVNGRAMEPRVYNRDFVEKNINKPNELEGIFTLGEEGKKIQQKIAAARQQRDQIQSRLDNCRRTLDNPDQGTGKVVDLAQLEEEYKDAWWPLLTRHKDDFRDAFIGVLKNKANFKGRLVAQSRSNQSKLLPVEELKSKASTLFGSQPSRQDLFEVPDNDIRRMIFHETNPILAKKVIGKSDVDIAALIEKLKNSDWVMQGKKYYDPNDRVCPFCQQRTPESLEQSLNEYFDDTFQKESERIAKLLGDYESDSNKLMEKLGNILDDITKDNWLDKVVFKNQLDLLDSKIDVNLNRIKEKQKQASVPVSLDSLLSVLEKIRSMLTKANREIKTHNKRVANFHTEKSQLVDEVWRYLLDLEQTSLVAYKTRKANLNSAIKNLKSQIQDRGKEIQELDVEIRTLESKTVSVQPTIDKINHTLEEFNFQGFKLVESGRKEHYEIQRSDRSNAAPTLSEGERSFIAFLYFYHLLQGSTTRSDLETDRIVVFDDPVSSLDSQVLYLVSTLIRKLFDDVRSNNGSSAVKQVFVLTHNVYFHREVSFRCDTPAKEGFWIVRKTGGYSKIEHHDKNPIKSTYELLWSEVKNDSPDSVCLRNAMRRILEFYCTFLGNDLELENIAGKLSGVEQDVFRSLISWLHAGSHAAVIEDADYAQEATVENYKEVFRNIFEETGQLGHYNSMMGE